MNYIIIDFMEDFVLQVVNTNSSLKTAVDKFLNQNQEEKKSHRLSVKG